MIHLHKSFHVPHLARIMTAAGLVLTVATVLTVAQSPQDDAAYAQSAQRYGTTQQAYASDGKPTTQTSSAPSGSNNKNGSTARTTTATPTPASAATSSSSATSPAAKPSTTKPVTPSPTPTPAVATPPAGTWHYPLHAGIKTTYFWAGEAASADNDFIQNVSSAWQDDWQSHFGGSDNPSSRCGYNPCAFTPRENPFYFALPFSDFTDSGPVADLSMVPWYDSNSRAQLNAGNSILKNRWIQITAAPGSTSKTVYAQWQDVGPFNEHDSGYVFGTAAPASTRAGLDVSPAVRDYLGMGGSTTSSWRFVDSSEVPAGPWKTTITTSGPDWH